jgi:hypothetical protein
LRLTELAVAGEVALRRGYDRHVLADEQTSREIEALVDATYEAMSTPGSNVAELFAADDIAIAGSGQGELWSGPGEVAAVAAAVSSMGYRWSPEQVTVWQRGDVAWAQILGSVRVLRDDRDELVPYLTTGVFGRENGDWHWLYWGGSEPQESAKV